MAVNPQKILKDLKNNQYAPVYFLQGEEAYYIDKISDYIEEHALEESQKGFNQMVFYGRDTDLKTVLSNARRFPMMSERQVVIVKEARDLSDFNQEMSQKLLEEYLKNPQPSTILVFCYKHKKLDGRKNIAKVLAKQTVFLTTNKLYDSQLPDWITDLVASQGYSITPKATFMLAENVGNDLERLEGEVEKIMINFNEPVEIDEHMVQKYVGFSKEYNVFELQKALATKNVGKANKVVNYFSSNPQKNPIIPMVALLFSFYSKLLLIHDLVGKGMQQSDLSSKLGVNPYFMKEYIAAAKIYSSKKIIENIHYLREADLHSKGIGASLDNGQILKELVFKLMH
jgi:DNA polymerase-3 subunit delta